MKTLTRNLMIGALTAISMNLAQAQETDTDSDAGPKYYSGSAMVVSANNEMVGQWQSLMMRTQSPGEDKINVRETAIDSAGFALWTDFRDLKVTSTMDTEGHKVTYSSMSPTEGSSVTGVEMEVAEGLFSEFRVFDSTGAMVNILFRTDSEISKSEYDAKLAQMKSNLKKQLRSPASLPH